METYNFQRAIKDFRSARQKATLREIIARLKGESLDLLSFEDVRHKLKAQIGSKKVLKEIPIKGIIGSVNRYQDFMRDFLPRRNINEERWINIDTANQGMLGLPPIEVYQIDEAYFVSDGNHRVSVAKQLGATEIQAYVTEVRSRVPLTDDIRLEDLILKSELVEFLENTNLDKLRPEAEIAVTEPGQYTVIEEHIAVHHYFMGIDLQHEIQYPEAILDWYDNIYLPVVNIIRERGMLIDFPNRTEADMYLWIADHRAALEEELQSQITVESAIEDLSDQYSQRTDRMISRLGAKIVNAIIPDLLDSGPPSGEWRQSIILAHRDDHLFCEILVPINGQQDGWCALDQAIVVAQRENTNIHGLYILAKEAEIETPFTQEIQNEFARRCEAKGMEYDLQIKSGDITTNICERARWSDLVVINISYPPESSALARLSSGIRTLIQRCPRPILFTPQVSKPLEHALLAFDDSIKSQEALFISSYLAGKWKIPLHVISMGDANNLDEIQEAARGYLEVQNIHAGYIATDRNRNTDTILDYIEKLNIDLLVTGGYSRTPLMEVIQGSDIDEFLRQVNIPIIICR